MIRDDHMRSTIYRAGEQIPGCGTKRGAQADIREIDDGAETPSAGALIGHWGRGDEEQTTNYAEPILETNLSEKHDLQKMKGTHHP